MTILYLVRHGETIDNARQVMQGQTQGALNEVGIQQAQELAERLKDERIDAFVASDLRRSVDTCRILAEPHRLPVITTPLLRERDWGSFTGRFIPDLKGEPWSDDIESLEALLSRAYAFRNYIKESFPDQRVVAVGHGIINKAIQAVHFDKKMRQVERMTNCEVRMLML